MFKLPRIEAAIQMVDNVSAVMRGVRASVESVTVPVNRLQNALSSLYREAQFSQLASAAGNFKDKLGGVGEGASKSFERLGGVLMGGAGVVTGMGSLLKVTADASDKIYDTAHRVDMTTDSFQRWRYAAQLSGSSIESSDAALERFSKGLAAARAGTGEALEPLKAMGIRLKDTNGKLRSQEDVLFDVSDAMAKIPDGQDRLRVSSALFGKGNQDMVAVMSQGSKAIKGMFADFQKLGGAIPEKDLETAGAFNDSLDKLHFAGMGLASVFAGQLFPVVTQLVTRFQDWALANRGALQQVGALIAQKLPGFLDQVGASFSRLVKQASPFVSALGWIMEKVGPLQFVLGALGVYIAGPFVASVLSAVPALFQLGKAAMVTGPILWRTMISAVTAAVPAMVGFVSTIWGAVVPALSGLAASIYAIPGVGWIAAAVAALGLGAVLVYKNWDKVSSWFVSLWEGISSFLDTSIGKILAVFVFPFVGIPLLIVKHWDKVSAFFVGLGSRLVAVLGAAVSAIASVVVPPFVALVGLITSAWEALPEALSTIWSNVSDFLGTGVGMALSVAFPFIGLPLQVIRNWKPLLAFFSNLWTSIGNGFRSLVDLVGKLWDRMNQAVGAGAGALSKTLEGVPLVGGLLSGAVGLFQNEPTGAPAAGGAAAATVTNVEQRSMVQRTDAAVSVDFRNLPAGARVSEPQGNANLTVTQGLAFGGGF